MAFESNPNEAYIALGANLGERLANLRAAVEALTEPGDIVCSVRSSVYETDPVGGPPGQPRYLNAVIGVRTSLGPADLLDRCREVERRLGRRRSVPTPRASSTWTCSCSKRQSFPRLRSSFLIRACTPGASSWNRWPRSPRTCGIPSSAPRLRNCWLRCPATRSGVGESPPISGSPGRSAADPVAFPPIPC